MRVLALSAAALVLTSPVAWADDGACTGFKWPLNREITAFQSEGIPTVPSGGTLPGLLAPAVLKLLPQEEVTYAIPPTRKPKPGPHYGGSFALPPIAAADTYQVTVSGDAWIDVLQNGKMLKQAGYTASHGCQVVHKSLRFPLAVGPATIEISDAAADSIKIEVAPKDR